MNMWAWVLVTKEEIMIKDMKMYESSPVFDHNVTIELTL